MRLTAQGRREGENLARIVRRLRDEGFDTAVVADIHFLPEVAAIAAQYVDKVRINPGNYRTDRGELEELIARCRERGVALRIGVNHGSLAKRVFDQWEIRRRAWSSRPWSSCVSARRTDSTRSSCR